MPKRHTLPERPEGAYAAIPFTVLDSEAFRRASDTARSLLFELIRQHNGRNNGHLHLARMWLKSRGWKSRDVVQRAIKNLQDNRLIIETRKGGLSTGPSCYALTWLAITNFDGLDIVEGDYHRGAYAYFNVLKLPSNSRARPATGTASTVPRSGVVPFPGIAEVAQVPGAGPTQTSLDNHSGPSDGNNAHVPLCAANRGAA